MYRDIASKINALPPDQKAACNKAAETIQRATQHQGQIPKAPANDNLDSNAALRQRANNQDKAAPAMSPTDRFNGATQGQAVAAPSKPAPTPSVPTPSRGQSRGR